MSCESTLQRPFKTGDRVSPGGLKRRVGNGKSNENPSDHRRGATGGDDGVQCRTGVSHAGEHIRQSARQLYFAKQLPARAFERANEIEKVGRDFA